MGPAEILRKPQKTTDERIRRRIQLIFGSAILTLLVAGTLSYRAIVVSSQSEQGIRHTHEVLERLQGVLLAAQTMESAYRGFVLTGDEAHLSRYPADLARMKRFHENLTSLVADNPVQWERLPALQALEDEKVKFAESIIALRRAKGFDAAVAAIRTGDGERIMFTFRDVIGDMRNEEIRLLAERTGHAERRLQQTKTALMLSIFLGLSVTGFAFWSIRRESLGRHLAERTLRESETKFRGILEGAPDSMIVTNQDGVILFLNRQTDKYFGYTREELIGQNILKLIPCNLLDAPSHLQPNPSDSLDRQPDPGQETNPNQEIVARPISYSDSGLESPGLPTDPQALAFRAVCESYPYGSSEAFERIGNRKDGFEFPVEIMLSPLELPEGRLYTASVRDITERKQNEVHLAEASAKLRISNIELQQFAYVASHDLQEPLRMVASYTQLLAKRYKGKLDADADQFIGFAVDGCNRMKRLIEDLLAYSRAGTSPKNLPSISTENPLREALSNLRAIINETEAVITYDPLPTLIGDHRVLVQILQNLIGNALKYRSEETPRIHIEARKNARKEWVFSIKDNGIGIDPQFAEKIFLLFQRLHGRGEYEGTGIGLAICKKHVERLGGRIWVESQPPNGSTFYFTLPEIQPTQTAATNPAPPTPALTTKPGDPPSTQPYRA